MQTRLAARFRDTPAGEEAKAILRNCVHCGFCNATCPTHRLLGDELDGPRGRIYLLKQVFEGTPPGRATQQHLDRCLGCRACETTCPSGVRYARLADLGREVLEREVPRPWRERLLRRLLAEVVPRPRLFGVALGIARRLAPLLPRALRQHVPAPQRVPQRPAPAAGHARRLLMLEGCVQQAATPATNAAAARVFDRLGFTVECPPGQGCCGALRHHLGHTPAALAQMRANIDAWWPGIEAGAEGIVINASGCAAMVKEYAHLLRHDPAYADKAARVSALARDPAEVLAQQDLSRWADLGQGRVLAFHSPCSLQHGEGLGGVVESLLRQLGFELTAVRDAHLCCGSAGTYSILQPALAEALRRDKLDALEAGRPERILTANVGCQLHLQAGTSTAVQHWLEAVDEALFAGAAPEAGRCG